MERGGEPRHRREARRVSAWEMCESSEVGSERIKEARRRFHPVVAGDDGPGCAGPARLAAKQNRGEDCSSPRLAFLVIPLSVVADHGSQYVK
jgi:hypothetical protein